MSNVSAATVFQGIEDAEVIDRNPKLPPESAFLLEVVSTELFDGNEGGVTFLIEHLVLESDNPSVKIGGLYSTTITGLTGQHKKTKLGKVAQYIAACYKKDPQDPEFKREVFQAAVYVAEKNATKGKRLRAKTGATQTHNAKGVAYVKPFTPVSFYPE